MKKYRQRINYTEEDKALMWDRPRFGTFALYGQSRVAA